MKFYDEVVEKSKVRSPAASEPGLPSENQPQTIAQEYATRNGHLTSFLQSSCVDFVKFLKSQHGDYPGVHCILVFDEAQPLTKLMPGGEHSYFHRFGSVLAKIVTQPVFTIFLSTNSNIRALAPPPHLHPSVRVATQEQQLLPPSTELPFDVFAWDLNDELIGSTGSTLSAVCSLNIMVRFGRTM